MWKMNDVKVSVPTSRQPFCERCNITFRVKHCCSQLNGTLSRGASVVPVSWWSAGCVRSGETPAASRAFSGVLWHEELSFEGVGEALVTSPSASVMTGLRPMPESAELWICMQGASRLASSSSMLLSMPAVVDSSSCTTAKQSKVSHSILHICSIWVINRDLDAATFTLLCAK